VTVRWRSQLAESERLVPPLPGAKTKNLLLRDRTGADQFLATVPHVLAVDLNALGEALAAGRPQQQQSSGGYRSVSRVGQIMQQPQHLQQELL
jgi:hypothetical protein